MQFLFYAAKVAEFFEVVKIGDILRRSKAFVAQRKRERRPQERLCTSCCTQGDERPNLSTRRQIFLLNPKIGKENEEEDTVLKECTYLSLV